MEKKRYLWTAEYVILKTSVWSLETKFDDMFYFLVGMYINIYSSLISYLGARLGYR